MQKVGGQRKERERGQLSVKGLGIFLTTTGVYLPNTLCLVPVDKDHLFRTIFKGLHGYILGFSAPYFLEEKKDGGLTESPIVPIVTLDIGSRLMNIRLHIPEWSPW